MLAYLRYGNAAEFFARFDIPIVPLGSPPQDIIYVSTSNSSTLTAYTPPSFPEQIAAFQTWYNTTARYADFSNPGLWGLSSW